MFVSTHVGSCPLGVPGLPSAVPGAAGLRVRPPPGSRLHEAGLPINWVISDKNTKNSQKNGKIWINKVSVWY